MSLIIRFIIVLFSVNVAYAGTVHGQPYFTFDRIELIEDYIKQGMKEEAIPGAAVALIENGRIVYKRGFGKADDEGAVVTSQTPFQLASITKSFSALLVLQLENEGKLALSDRVVEHIPWFSTANQSLSDQITIRNLLQHNSGFTTGSGNFSQNSTYRGDDATELSVRELDTTELHSQPGTRYEYSNSNYHVVSHLVELLEGKRFEQVMAERILQPLNMQNSFVQIAEHEVQKPAVGFPHWFGYPIEREFTLGRMKMGDGGLVASVEDLAAYLLEVAYGELDIVTLDMRKNLLSAEQNNAAYGLGWEVYSNQGQQFYEHGGTNGGFNNLMGFSDATDQRGKVGFVILTNYSSALHDQFIWNLRRVILDNAPHSKRFNMVNLTSLITLYITTFLLIFFLYRTVKQSPPVVINSKVFITPTLLLLFSYTMAYIVPAMNKINLLSIYPFFPDLAVGLIACALLSFVLSILKLFKLTKVV